MFSTKCRRSMEFSIYQSVPIRRATQAYCPVCYSVFVLLKVQCSFLHGPSPPCMNAPGPVSVERSLIIVAMCGKPPLSFETRFWSIHKPFFWDFLWQVSVEAFPLWARRCDAWYSSCQCFWCTPCNRCSWDSITLSASWGNIFPSPWNSYLVCCLFCTARTQQLSMEWESLSITCLCAQCSTQRTCWPWRWVLMLWFDLFDTSSCLWRFKHVLVLFHLGGNHAESNQHSRKTFKMRWISFLSVVKQKEKKINDHVYPPVKWRLLQWIDKIVFCICLFWNGTYVFLWMPWESNISDLWLKKKAIFFFKDLRSRPYCCQRAVHASFIGR